MLRELKVYLLLTHLSLLGTTLSASLLQRLCYRCRLSRSGVNYHPPTSQAKEKKAQFGCCGAHPESQQSENRVVYL